MQAYILNVSMNINLLKPDYIFESSWEVCNKVGGIYAVLSTRANTLQKVLKDKTIFIGPDCWHEKENIYFTEDKKLFADWKKEAEKNKLKIKIGKWNVPGKPISILVDFEQYYDKKNEIYGKLWEDFQVDSLHAYGDYDEASMFSYAAAKVVESFYRFYLNDSMKVIYHGNEWMTGLGLLYIKRYMPQIATIFTTHATSIGRSIAGNNKPLYDYLFAYNGDQMAGELNMQSKHSIEKQTAHNVDCFTTVSEITANECKELLDKPVDVILPNRFEDDFIEVPGWCGEPRQDLIDRLKSGKKFDTPLDVPMITHWLHNMSHDNVLGMLKFLNMQNRKDDNVKLIFLPCYLDGNDGIINISYYDIVLGNDLCIYPSYYEPWGYTPLEAVAFKVPCITTDLAGFGLWANSVKGGYCEIEDGVKVVHRTDYNYSEVADAIKDTVAKFSNFDDKQIKAARKNAFNLSKKALWSEFIKYYYEAYDFALRKAEDRKQHIAQSAKG